MGAEFKIYFIKDARSVIDLRVSSNWFGMLWQSAIADGDQERFLQATISVRVTYCLKCGGHFSCTLAVNQTMELFSTWQHKR